MESSRRRWVWLGLAVAVLLAAMPVQAQNPTGELTGRVTDPDGSGLPGVTVTGQSPGLQGTRTAQTGNNGDYKLAFLPPGTYRVTYELEGFATLVRDVRVPAAQTATSDVQMQVASVSEEIQVTAANVEISDGTQSNATIGQEELEKLPVARDLRQAMLLTPGVADTGPTTSTRNPGEPSIAGAMTFENLYLINGVVLNENVRGQLLPLFIEDAIQETTTTVSGVSAEYGRFTGGVINAITKSGGNEFSGSFRTSFTNDDWVGSNDLSPERLDKINESYEATLGGYMWKDHLWFFAAGRDRKLDEADRTFVTLLDFQSLDDEQRYEGKLTLTPHPNHSLIGSYFKIDRIITNDGFGTFISLESLNDREDPQEIKSLNYTGILTPSFFVEAQYSEREYQIAKGAGGVRDLIEGTMFRTRAGPFRWHAPTFCGQCQQELRNNENALAKASYFLTTETMGSHDLVFGYDTFEDIRFSINHQTGSDFTVWASNQLIAPNGTVFPVIAGATTWIGWFAVFNEDLARPTAFKTNSYYVNDSWQLNDRWSFNLGARYDLNDGTNSAGAKVTDDSKISPRLGLSWDVKGDGDLIVNAAAGNYVAAIASSLADSTSNGGAIGLFLSTYGGPTINTNSACVAAGTCVSNADALRTIFNWYFANGGTDDVNGDLSRIPNLISVSIPGETAIIRDPIKSPSTIEYTLGVSKRLGSKGSLRADLVYRDWEDFYANNITLPNGRVDTSAGPVDLSLVGNFDDGLSRTYKGLHTQFRYRLTDRFTVAGNYTLSQTEGNVDGETAVGGPVSTSPFAYPEYTELRWAFPEGDLATDQRHRARVWGIYDIFDTEHHRLSASLLQSFASGTPYGAFSASGVDTRQEVGNIGYAIVPESFNYWFTARDAFHTDDITRTDLSLNYSFLWNVLGDQVEIYLQPEVINVFNEDKAVLVNTSIFTDANSSTAVCSGAPCQPFNPFTEVPVEGVHWAKGPNFGRPTNENNLQTPRTFRFSVGFRF